MGGPEKQLGDLQRAHNAGHHPPRHGNAAEELQVGLVHQSQRF